MNKHKFNEPDSTQLSKVEVPGISMNPYAFSLKSVFFLFLLKPIILLTALTILWHLSLSFNGYGRSMSILKPSWWAAVLAHEF